MMSPGWTADSGTCGRLASCAWAECGSETPACAHAHDVRPEQSNASGPAAPKTYGAPITEYAAPTAICAALAFGCGTYPPVGGGSAGTGAETDARSCAAAAAAARCWAAIAACHWALRFAARVCCSARFDGICCRSLVIPVGFVLVSLTACAYCWAAQAAR